MMSFTIRVPDMARSIPGPHHCVSLGIHEAMNVFKFLRENCDPSQSAISRSDLDALMQRYLLKMSREMAPYYDSSARCYASINAGSVIFNMRRLTHVLLHEWLSDCIRKTFHMQTRDTSKNWGMVFTNALIKFAGRQIGIDLAHVVARRYNTLAFTMAEKMTVGELLQDAELVAVFEDFVRRFRPVLTNDEALDQLCKFVNKEIDERFNSFGPNRLNICKKDLTVFFQKRYAQM